MDNSFNSIISSSPSILVMLPAKLNFDAVAAGLSLYLALRGEKDVSIFSPTPVLVEFNRLVGVNKIANEVGNKNLTIKFVDYKANDIERVSYDIENGEFRLTVIPKPGAPSPKKEQLATSYSGISASCVILVGGETYADFPALSSPGFSGIKIVHVGVRAITAPSDRTVLSFARPASSLSELSASLIKESGITLDVDMASNLLAGIWEGSRELKGEEVSADTFETVAALMRTGAKLTPRQNVVGTYPITSTPQDEKSESAPKDWLEPKIYKGTSIS